MKVAIYVRVSTEDQNIDTQLLMCRQYCERTGHTIYKEYQDIGISGKNESRPAFNQLMEDMRNFKYDAVCVYKLDRLGRSLAHLIKLFEEFELKKVNFISVTQNIDTLTAEGRMYMRLMMVLAEYEREMTVDRVKDGLKRAVKAGKILGRPKTEYNKYDILKLKAQGHSIREIARHLNIGKGIVSRCIKNNPLEQEPVI